MILLGPATLGAAAEEAPRPKAKPAAVATTSRRDTPFRSSAMTVPFSSRLQRLWHGIGPGGATPGRRDGPPESPC